MKKEITGEEAFSCASGAIAIPATSNGYTINYSADGVTWTEYEEEVPADENCFIMNAIVGTFFKLVGNTDTINIIC